MNWKRNLFIFIKICKGIKINRKNLIQMTDDGTKRNQFFIELDDTFYWKNEKHRMKKYNCTFEIDAMFGQCKKKRLFENV